MAQALHSIGNVNWMPKMNSTAQDISPENLSLIQAADTLRKNNVEFFKKFHKGIYERYKDYRLKEYNVSFNTELKQFDVLKNGKSIYNDVPLSYAREELAKFYEEHAPGKHILTIAPPFLGAYYLPRYFHQRCSHLLSISPLTRENFRGYKIPDFYPMMVFNGIGAGYHIQEFLEKNNVLNCLIHETEDDLFATSLYTIDWEKICEPFVDDPNKSIHFILGPSENELAHTATQFRYLTKHCPSYPLTTFFINHRKNELFIKMTKKITEDTTAFVTVWGHYDDEIYQLNNCIHNLHRKHTIIKPNLESALDLPLIIVGAGPSLNSRIKQLRSMQDKALIVSCGTAIHSLYHFGIKPDLHLELESHLVTLTQLEALGDNEWLSTIPLIGPTQLPPKVFSLFKHKAMYFKGESVTSLLFGDKDSSVNRGTPTCTNSAVALFLRWAFKKVYLFGIDLGYKNTSDHHAKGSVYYKTKDRDLLLGADVKNEATVTMEAVDGSTMKTKPILYTAKRTMETCCQAFIKTTEVFNCSDGVKLDYTQWLDSSSVELGIDKKTANKLKEEFLNHQFFNNNKSIDEKTTHDRIEILDHNIKELNTYIIEILQKIEPTPYSMTANIVTISKFLDDKLKPSLPPFYFFIRGSIWHLLFIGYSHMLSIDNEEQKQKWINDWKTESIKSLTGLHDHFNKIMKKEFIMEEDSWTWVSTSEPE